MPSVSTPSRSTSEPDLPASSSTSPTVTSSWHASRSTRRAPSRPTASAASGRPGSPRFCSFPWPIPPSACHHGMFVTQDAYERIKSLPQLEPRIVKPRGWTLISLNHKAGLMTSKPLRQAVQAALDMESLMTAAFGHKDFYRVAPALFFPEQPWNSNAGAALYNQRDRDKAKRLMKEAGYSGQTVRWVTTRE